MSTANRQNTEWLRICKGTPKASKICWVVTYSYPSGPGSPFSWLMVGSHGSPANEFCSASRGAASAGFFVNDPLQRHLDPLTETALVPLGEPDDGRL